MQVADLIIQNANLITMSDQVDQSYGLLQEGSLVIHDGTIVAVGNRSIADQWKASQTIDTQGAFVSPGLIDCHTHTVFGGNRADEWEQRLAGASYEEIAKKGGGILSTVTATRRATEDELFFAARKRLEYMLRHGVTTVEIKSGYGLDTDTELKMLQVATRLNESTGIDVSRTFLGAHALPPEYQGQPDSYIEVVCSEMIPRAKEWCEAVDVFCEKIAFNLDQTKQVLQASLDHELAIKIHAEQLSLLGGAKLAAELNAWSADHLEYLDESGVAAMANSKCVATLLPGAFYFIHETQKPPIELFRKYSVPIAVATDFNPGSSPVASLLLAMNMACTLFGLTAEESFAGVTQNAAKALRLDDRGTLDVGKIADLVVWDIQSPSELAYGIGHNPCRQVFKNGKLIIDHSERD